METGDAVPSNNLPIETNSNDGIDDGPSGSKSNEVMKTDSSDIKPNIDFTAGPSNSDSDAVHVKVEAQAASSSSEGGICVVMNFHC